MKTIPSLVLGATLVASLASAQVNIAHDGRANKVPVPRAGLSKQDLGFLSDAKISIMFEIATSKVALARATTPWGREFAKEMIDEHTNAGNALDMIAKDKGVGLPTGLPSPSQTIVAKLLNVNAASFDQTYRKIQIDSHQQSSAVYGREVKSGHDSAVRDFAITTLPALRMHLKLAQLQKTMMGETKIQTNQ